MRAVCAWCGIDLKRALPPGTGLAGLEITHGICDSCAQHFFGPRDTSVRGFLNTLEAPVVVVDDDVRTLEANDAALAALGKTREQVAGRLGGEIIECANSRLPGGCGHTTHCTACTIRNSVQETFETGRSFSHVPAWVRLHTETEAEAKKKMRVEISTEKVGDVVLLRLDEIRH
jgi:PAS domain-containing protein